MPAVATIREAEHIKSLLLEALHEKQKIVVDCRAVDEVDLSFVQLVLSARKSAAAANKPLGVIPPPSGLMTDVLRSAGLLRSADEAPADDQLFWFNKEPSR